MSSARSPAGGNEEYSGEQGNKKPFASLPFPAFILCLFASIMLLLLLHDVICFNLSACACFYKKKGGKWKPILTCSVSCPPMTRVDSRGRSNPLLFFKHNTCVALIDRCGRSTQILYFSKSRSTRDVVLHSQKNTDISMHCIFTLFFL